LEPKSGHGAFKKLAHGLKISTTLVSQVFNGDKDLSPEQAYLLTKHFDFNAIETDYFIALVSKARAGQHTYRAYCDQQISNIRQKAKKTKHRINPDGEVSDQARMQFYADWRYSAVRLACDLNHIEQPNDIAVTLNIPLKEVLYILDFLVEHDLVTQTKNGELAIGKRHIHLEKDSPLFKMRQSQWRLQGLKNINTDIKENDLFYTSMVALSKTDVNRVSEILLNSIRQMNSVVVESDSEELHCLNIDWFKV
jgi:uncharacterized protein (TIGR02147 family)